MRINKTYIIEDPIVQPINKKYPNLNKNIELLVHRGTILREAQQQLTYDNLNFDFKEFVYVNENPVTDNEHDVIGILMKVRQVTRFERKDKLGFGYRKEVILINTMLQTITINLWDDLALNEGQLLKENRIQNSIVAFCNLKMSIYHGFPQLQSTFTTGMLQNPKCNKLFSNIKQIFLA
ncbi:replication protein A 70 kDa DNA-binding subunit B-like [Primulina huaijiensis]|uniref:replication protein A 70 kDa DNA-binding subunit B-like n=1 Tax=Primulina huaijiensis TaxID=1492673 RepID=UPI003CC70AC7